MRSTQYANEESVSLSKKFGLQEDDTHPPSRYRVCSDPRLHLPWGNHVFGLYESANRLEPQHIGEAHSSPRLRGERFDERQMIAIQLVS